ncbi:MAG TPA: hypothetical protein VF699_06015 [Caulobacteraceae bacterium]|jgi:hypothetical protein
MTDTTDRTHHYVLLSSSTGWMLTRDGRPIGQFGDYDQASSVASRITADLRKGGVDVDLVLPERPGRVRAAGAH